MNIVMVTNTYLPHVGGVARSVDSFARAYRALGHRVLVVAPEFAGQASDETDVVRIPAIQNFNGSDFSVVLPVPGILTEALAAFRPAIIHAHHPYLLGMTALRKARRLDLPLVFTHHTLHEQYTHYVPGNSIRMGRFVVQLATGYANLADHVFAPSDSVAAMLRARGVSTPISVLPTGIEPETLSRGDRWFWRRRLGIPDDAFVVGHLGRLAVEKNLDFLARAVAEFLARTPRAWCLVAGAGPAESAIRAAFEERGVDGRLRLAGVVRGQGLRDAYHAMDVFAFSSHSETQGMVVAEAMAAGLPVVALDAPGVREVLQDGRQGRLLHGQDQREFASALRWVLGRAPAEREMLRRACRARAARFALGPLAAQALSVYERHALQPPVRRVRDAGEWYGPVERVLERLRAEWDIVRGVVSAAGAAMAPGAGEAGSRPFGDAG